MIIIKIFVISVISFLKVFYQKKNKINIYNYPIVIWLHRLLPPLAGGDHLVRGNETRLPRPKADPDEETWTSRPPVGSSDWLWKMNCFSLTQLSAKNLLVFIKIYRLTGFQCGSCGRPLKPEGKTPGQNDPECWSVKLTAQVWTLIHRPKRTSVTSRTLRQNAS